MPSAPILARRLFAEAERVGVERALPFWGDGGRAGRHVLAAFPERVVRLPIAQDREALASALRDLLPRVPTSARSPLVVFALAYDAGRALEAIGKHLDERREVPDLVVARYPGYLVADDEAGPWRAVGEVGRLSDTLSSAPSSAIDDGSQSFSLELVDPASRASYRAGIELVRERLIAGDLYQANIARRLDVGLENPSAVVPAAYAALRARQPNGYGALWGLDDTTWLASNSPECLLRWDAATRTARSFPIKGTRPRAVDPERDALARAELVASEKDRAEHVMIVDLVRNDLGKVADIGSVRVESLYEVMSLATVFHLVSTVAATVAPEHDLVDVLLALFPGGSITGAPKIAAMKLIDRVEPFRRGYYCGSLGVVFGGAEAVVSILIRTLVAAAGRLSYGTGGGIVVDSDPEHEWDETETKACALRDALSHQLKSQT